MTGSNRDRDYAQSSLDELARICDRGGRSRWPSSDRWRNADAWQEGFANIAAAIERGTVDTSRPLRPLAYRAAYNAFLTEQERSDRYCQLTDVQLRDFLTRTPALEEQPDEEAERHVEEGRRGDALRTVLFRLLEEGKLDGGALKALHGRYTEERSASQVARSLGIGADAVRQRCSRSCLLIRKAMSMQGLCDGATG